MSGPDFFDQEISFIVDCFGIKDTLVPVRACRESYRVGIRDDLRDQKEIRYCNRFLSS